MALKPLYGDFRDNVALNVVVVPGIGLPRPEEWKNSSGDWLKKLQEQHGHDVCIYQFDYKIVQGFSIKDAFLQQSDILRKLLQALWPKHAPPKPILIVCQSLGGCLWKETYASLGYQMNENSHILENIVGVVFLGTPHIEDVSRLDDNILETVMRATTHPFKFFAITQDDNQWIARMTGTFGSFKGRVISTFETIQSPVRQKKLRELTLNNRLVISEDLVNLSSISDSERYGIQNTHENVCKIDIGGGLHKAIERIVDVTIDEYKQRFTGSADQHDLKSVSGFSSATLHSHRSQIRRSTSDAMGDLSLGSSNSTKRGKDLSAPSSSEEQQDLGTGSATAGGSSQMSLDKAIISEPFELDKPTLSIPCFSVGSQTHKTPFFGREEILQSIDEILLPSSTAPPSTLQQSFSSGNLKTYALCGAGGIGKTELASEYVFSRKEAYHAILWVTADSRNVLLEDFARVALELGLQAKKDAQDLAEACELVKGWLCNPVKNLDQPLSTPNNEVPWLLVFDNVDDWTIIEDFWPTTGIGSVLITSRDPLSRSHVYTAKQGLDLEPFSSTDSLEFLTVVSERKFEGSPVAAEAIAEWSGGLPLIMTAIASMMSSQDLSYNTMLELLKQRGFEAVSADDKPQLHSVQNITIASMIGLASLDDETRSLIQTISYLNPEGIPQRILVGKLKRAPLEAFPKEEVGLDRAQSKLRQASLVTVNETTMTLRMHRIYQDIVRESLSVEMQINSLLVAVEIISEAWKYQPLEKRFNTERYEACSELFPHVDRIYHHYDDMFQSRKIDASEEVARLCNDAGWYWFERGLPQESKPFFRLAQSICEVLQRTKPSEKIAEMLRESHNNQGSAANETNNPEESLAHNLTWLSLMRERKNPDGTGVIDYELGCTYNEVGVAYPMNGLYPLALDFFQQSVSTYESLPGYDEKWLGWPLPNIGMVQWIQGDHKAALESLDRMREIYETAYGPNDTKSFKTGKVLYGLGNVYLSLGNLDRALQFHLRCLTQWSITLGTDHHRIGDVSHKLAQVYMGQTRFHKSQESIDRALKIFARNPYHKHEHTRTLFLQGQLYAAQGKDDLAEQSFKDAHSQRRKLKPNEPLRSWDELSEKDYDELMKQPEDPARQAEFAGLKTIEPFGPLT